MRELKRYLLKPLVLIGGLNWGLIGLFNFNLVTYLFGIGTTFTHIVYSVIGIAALIMIIMMFIPHDYR